MRQIYNKIRMMTEAIRFSGKSVDDFYKKQLGYSKVIGYENGLPVYSLLFPALLSDAYRHCVVDMMIGMMKQSNIPLLASFAINDECNSNCESCCLKSTHKKGVQFTLKEIFKCIEDIKDIGAATTMIVGGEPLMHPQILEVIRKFSAHGLNMAMFTNGWYLAEKAEELRNAGLKRIYVSIDSADPARNDRYRGHEGLLKKAVNSIKAARKNNILVGISTTIRAETTISEFEGVIALAKDLGVCEIFASKLFVKDDNSSGFDRTNDAYFKAAMKVNDDRKEKLGIFYYPYFASKGFGCSSGSTRLYINPYGEVTPCDISSRSFGNVKEEPLSVIWERMTRADQLGYVTMAGCRGRRNII
jgi:MoaA/NifB/PqqE/SkfB family radical SAM enzyme